MKKIVKMSVATAMLMGMGSVSAQAEGLSIMEDVYLKGEIRPRYEMVDTDNTVGNANAVTNRLVIGAGADKLFGLDMISAYAEMTDVHQLNHDNFNDSETNPNNKNLVVDPEQTRLTQAYIDVKFGKSKIRTGRQMINLDNQRFVGAVGWRQMFQTFDATSLMMNEIENLDVFASYVTRRNTVNTGIKDGRDVLLNASYKVMPELKVTAYGYLLGSQHDTYGAALTGAIKASDSLKVTYRAEYATQTDASMDDAQDVAPGADEADASYMRFDLGVNMSGILAGVGYESLSGADSGDETAFTTPYSTLHAHNGWADIFLAQNGFGGNPDDGLEDMSAYIGYKAKGFGLAKVVFHDFSSEVGSVDYGTEIDAVYKNKVPGVKGLSAMIKGAFFSAGDSVAAGNIATASVDKTVVWLMADYKFSTK